jgi:predicted NBD/HSP70 family sugar kinase
MRGGDTSGLRAYNERLIISAIRAGGAMSKAEIARATGLSVQAARVIVDALIDGETLLKLPKIRGLVGQPSTPIALNPAGAYSVGVKIGRRSLEVVLVDMMGDVVRKARMRQSVPLPAQTLQAVCAMVQGLLADAPRGARDRVVGLGIAMPGDLHEWPAQMGVGAGALAGWKGLDPARALQDATGIPARVINDATAACAAEMIVGDAMSARDALYIYVGAFVGGGVVLDGRLMRGAQMNAGALGSMPMAAQDAQGYPAQLIHLASAIELERMLEDAGLGGEDRLSAGPTPARDAVFDAWAVIAAPALARAAVAAMAVFDFEAVVIDGVIGPVWRARLARLMAAEMTRFNHAGLSRATVAPGSIGPAARVLGAALLPLMERFCPDPDLIAAARRPPTAR